MAPPQAIPILDQMEDTSIQVSHLWSPGGCVSSQGPRPDFSNGPGNNSNCGWILGPRRLFESDSNNGPSSGHSNLGQMEDTSVQVSHLWCPGGCNTG